MAEFKFVYIAEAHAVDEWPISSARYNQDRGPVCLLQAKNTAERREAARTFVRDFDLTPWFDVLIDPIEAGQPFDALLAPWPTRFFIIRNDTSELLYSSVPSEASFHNVLLEMQLVLNAGWV